MNRFRRRLAGVLAVTLSAAGARAQTAPPAATPTAPAPAAESHAAPPPPAPTPRPAAVPLPGASMPSRIPETITPPPIVLPKENPYGAVVEVPAALPTKLPFAEGTAEATLFASVKVDRAGKAGTVRIIRDALPGINRLVQASLGRWTFAPARLGGQPTDAWASLRIDLNVIVDEPKIERQSLTPVAPEDPLAVPIARGRDDEWYDALPAAVPADGATPVERLESPAVPNKTRWDADVYRGPFSVRFLVHVDAAGRIDRAIPLDASDPGLLPYFRRTMAGWALRPARVAGAPAATWNELALAGQIRYEPAIKQIQTLRKTLPAPAPASVPATPGSR